MAKSVKIERRNNSGIILALFLLFGAAMVFISYYAYNYVTPTDKFFSVYNTEVENELANLIKNQKQMDNQIKEISNDSKYTLEDPFIVINPYKVSPLSALIVFQTKDESSVKVYINDQYVTTVESSKKHLIPIYGLYANSKNIVELKLDDDSSNSYEITTKSFNNNLSGIDIGKMDKEQRYFILGNILDNNSKLRGFDYKSNLMFYLDLSYINGVQFHYDTFYVGYNSKKSNELAPIKIEFDYLGRIRSITDNTVDLVKSETIGNDTEKYIVKKIELYKKSINNYKLNNFVNETGDIKPLVLDTSTIENDLDNADNYNNYFNISINGDYISYYFKEDVDLVLIKKDSAYSYIYPVQQQGILKLDNIDNYVALYVKINENYYNLLTTLKK